MIDILGLDKQKLPKFVDLTITFSLASENKDKQQSAYEILKNVPDVRVYFKWFNCICYIVDTLYTKNLF